VTSSRLRRQVERVKPEPRRPAGSPTRLRRRITPRRRPASGRRRTPAGYLEILAIRWPWSAGRRPARPVLRSG